MVFIAAFISLAIAWYFMQKDRIRREERRERIREKQEELLERIRSAAGHDKPGVE